MHFVWYGEQYKDMPISVDFAPCIEVKNLKCEQKLPKYPFEVEKPKNFAFTKQINSTDGTEIHFLISTTDLEQQIIGKLPPAARDGLKLAKAIRLTELLMPNYRLKLSGDVTDIHDCLKTYHLKTSLLHLLSRFNSKMFKNCSFSSEQWALMIYANLRETLQSKGQLSMFGRFGNGDNLTHLLKCKHFKSVSTIPKTKRRQCCRKYNDVFSLVTNYFEILTVYCKAKHIVLISLNKIIKGREAPV